MLLRHASTCQTAKAEIVLRRSIALLCRHAKPMYRFGLLLEHADTLRTMLAESDVKADLARLDLPPTIVEASQVVAIGSTIPADYRPNDST